MRWVGRGCNRRRGERGSQVVEFALIVPFLMVLLLSVPVFGLAMRSWLVVTMAARDGARQYAVTEKVTNTLRAEQDAIQIIDNQIRGQGLMQPRGINIKPDYPVQGYVTVTVTYNQPAIFPGLALLLNPTGNSPMSFPIEARSIFRIER